MNGDANEPQPAPTAPTYAPEWTLEDWRDWYLTAIEVGQETIEKLHAVEAERDKYWRALVNISGSECIRVPETCPEDDQCPSCEANTALGQL